MADKVTALASRLGILCVRCPNPASIFYALPAARPAKERTFIARCLSHTLQNWSHPWVITLEEYVVWMVMES